MSSIKDKKKSNMDFKIAVLAGDGIGPEISVQGVEVMSAVNTVRRDKS